MPLGLLLFSRPSSLNRHRLLFPSPLTGLLTRRL
jgi:hypothetical protein